LGTLISSPIDASPCIDTITHDIPKRSRGLWHQRLGHINVQKMKLVHQQKNLIYILNILLNFILSKLCHIGFFF
jgi:hypothetical protein